MQPHENVQDCHTGFLVEEAKLVVVVRLAHTHTQSGVPFGYDANDEHSSRGEQPATVFGVLASRDHDNNDVVDDHHGYMLEHAP